MNLADLERATRAAFPDEEQADRAFAFVEMAWNAGKRSGHAQSIEKKAGECAWDEWVWDDLRVDELTRYAQDHYWGDDVERASRFVRESVREAGNWARSKSAKRPDWTSFVKSWMDRRFKKMPPRPNPQRALFESTSSAPSPASLSLNDRRQGARKDGALRLLRPAGKP